MRGGFIYSYLTARMTTQLMRVYGTVAVVPLPFAGGVGISFLFNAKGAELRALRCLLQREYEAESRCKQEVRYNTRTNPWWRCPYLYGETHSQIVGPSSSISRTEHSSLQRVSRFRIHTSSIFLPLPGLIKKYSPPSRDTRISTVSGHRSGIAIP